MLHPPTSGAMVNGFPTLSGRAAVLLILAAVRFDALAAPAPTGPAWARHVIDDSSRGSDGTKLADINGDGWLDVTTGWEEGGATRVYLNPGPNLAKARWPAVTVGSTPSAEDAVFADLDGDGNADVVTCAEGNTQRVFVHWAPADRAKMLQSEAWKQDVIPVTQGVTRWMFAEPIQLDGRNGIDLVVGGKRGGGTSRSFLGWLESPASPRDVAGWKWHPMIEMGWTMSINLEDMDGDGDADILYSDRMDKTRGVYWLENPGSREVAAGARWNQHRVWSAGVHGVMFLATGDVDGDGRRDVAVAVELEKAPAAEPERHGRVMWFKRADASGRRWLENTIVAPANTGSMKSVALGDIDGDGTADLVVSCENAVGDRIGVYWLRQDGKRASGGWDAFNISGAPGVKFDLVRLLDLDGDGDLDVLTNDEREGKGGLGVIWYENPRGNRK
ncbi:MAG: VCBS repeat-containing protein [Opitutaceae bacterium]|nr:VCBS repeat-containing protein [Opitutaceae bacterium]